MCLFLRFLFWTGYAICLVPSLINELKSLTCIHFISAQELWFYLFFLKIIFLCEFLETLSPFGIVRPRARLCKVLFKAMTVPGNPALPVPQSKEILEHRVCQWIVPKLSHPSSAHLWLSQMGTCFLIRHSAPFLGGRKVTIVLGGNRSFLCQQAI